MQDRSPVALCRGNAEAKLVRGNFLRITDLRFRPAYISVAVSRTTVRRRIVEHSEPDRHHGDGPPAHRLPPRAGASRKA